MNLSREEWEKLVKWEKILKRAAQILRVEDKDLPRVVKRFKKEVEEMKEELGLRKKHDELD